VPGDRRVVQVTLTDGGAQAVAAFEAGVTSVLDSLLQPLPAADRAEFRRMASVVVGAAQGATPAA
jgi:DNA-binding MarR family transcriptional regulator